MAQCRITEYEKLADAQGFKIQIGQEPAIANQNVSYDAATASAAFNGRTRYVRIDCSATGHLAFGDAPTATADSTRVQADTPEYFGVVPGQKVSIYDGSS